MSEKNLNQLNFSNGVYSAYGYDTASRLPSLNHKKTVDNSVILGYAATYDAASRLTQAVESPATATTTYVYDNANRLTSEDRTGASPYLSDYTYNSRGLRATAFRSEDGVTSHDGTYTYDDASRLNSVSYGGSSEAFSWYADNTVKTYPGTGYDRLLDYDEESHLISIKRDNGTTQSLVFEYRYGFDGGRRWRKDYAQNVWNWYPCGVACRAGDLIVLGNSIDGSTWSTQWSFLPTSHGRQHSDALMLRHISGQSSMVLDGNLNIEAVPICDRFGTDRSDQTDTAMLLIAAMLIDQDDEKQTSKLRTYGQPGCTLDELDPCTDRRSIGDCVKSGYGDWPQGIPKVVGPPRPAGSPVFDYFRCTSCCNMRFWYGEYHGLPNTNRGPCISAKARCLNECERVRNYNSGLMLWGCARAAGGFVPKVSPPESGPQIWD
jgi:YD repeat-containing protein